MSGLVACTVGGVIAVFCAGVLCGKLDRIEVGGLGSVVGGWSGGELQVRAQCSDTGFNEWESCFVDCEAWTSWVRDGRLAFGGGCGCSWTLILAQPQLALAVLFGLNMVRDASYNNPNAPSTLFHRQHINP